MDVSSDEAFGAPSAPAQVHRHAEPASETLQFPDGLTSSESTSSQLSSRGQDGRAQPALAATEGSVATGASESSAAGQPQAVQAKPAAGSDESVPCVSRAELQERAGLMFVIDADEPVTSGKGSAMPYPTNELVQRCWTEVCEVAATIGKHLTIGMREAAQVVCDQECEAAQRECDQECDAIRSQARAQKVERALESLRADRVPSEWVEWAEWHMHNTPLDY